MTDETLSRLLDGDLPEAEAEAARAAIAADPALAAQWAAMQALPAGLAGLTDSPPPAMPRPGPPPPALAAISRTLAPWAAAIAALALLGMWLRPAEHRVLVDGSEWIDGHVSVLAGGVPVVVEGRARISVEPPAALQRELQHNSPEIAAMDKSHLLAALAGAAVAVTVYEGRAAIDSPAGDVVLEAGETWSSAPPAPGAPAQRVVRVAGPEAATDAVPADLAARVAELERENQALRMAEAVQRGRVQSHEGTPQPWPEDLPAAFRPEGVEGLLDEVLAELGGSELLVDIDCDEYPCLVLLDSLDPDGGFGDVKAIGDALKERLDDAGIGIRAMGVDTGDGPRRMAGLTLTPADDAQDPDLEARIGHRLDAALHSELGEPGDGGGQDEDVDVQTTP